MGFGVASYSFDIYSETFIRNHVAMIVPGSTTTVAVGEDGNFLSEYDPALCTRLKKKNILKSNKFDSLTRLFFYGSVYGHSLAESRDLASFLVENGVRVVLAEYGPVGCAVVSACKKADVKLYVHFHGYDASKLIKKWHVRYSYKRLARNTAGFIFPSKFLANKLKAIGIDDFNFHVVPCCVDTDDFAFTTDKEENLVLCVGRFVPKKAPHKTILAFSKLLRHFPNIKLEMIGDGELLPMCQDLVKTLMIDQSVIFHGSKEHSFIQQRLSKATLFLQHSVTAPDGDTEGLGVSLLEAMSTGAVVVATRHNGFVETVVEGETGFLVDENDVDAMAECCLCLLRDEELLHSMRQKARQRVEDLYTVDQQMTQLREIMGLKI